MSIQTTFSRWVAAAALVGALVGGTACPGHQAPVQVSPAVTEALQTRIDGAVVADNFKTAAVIIRQAAALADSLPIPAATKDAVDCAVVKAMGTTNGPSPATVKICGAGVPAGEGPVVTVTKLLGSVTTHASLKSTIAAAMPFADAVLKALEASDNVSLKALGATLRAALAFAASIQ